MHGGIEPPKSWPSFYSLLGSNFLGEAMCPAPSGSKSGFSVPRASGPRGRVRAGCPRRSDDNSID
jgi:hypothetical protein